jgi:AcrR family transcriptional regulator
VLAITHRLTRSINGWYQLSLTSVSSFSARSSRSDARRNERRLLDAAAEAIADDPAASLERIARRAGVSRATLYAHFAGREALLDALTAASVADMTAALRAATPDDGPADEAMVRVLRAAWRTIGRYRGLVIVNQRLSAADLRARTAPATGLVRELILRGQRAGAFDPELPADWLLGAVVDLIHSASRQVSAGAMDAADAEQALLRTAEAVLTSHRASPSRRRPA